MQGPTRRVRREDYADAGIAVPDDVVFSPVEGEISADAYEHKLTTVSCAVWQCDHAGTEVVTRNFQAKWRSGRSLQGRLIERIPICEEHFEALARGEDVEIQ